MFITEYKLLKDLPTVKAGAILKKEVGMVYYFYTTNSDFIYSYKKEVVENSPEWFTPYLFTTEDNVKLFAGDNFYVVENGKLTVWEVDLYSKDNEPQSEIDKTVFKAETWTARRNKYKYFSTKEAALNYVESLKPKFKVGDIVNWYQFGVIGKILDLNDNTAILDNPMNEEVYLVDLEKASEEQVIKYYERLGWVKGAKLKQLKFVINNKPIQDTFTHFEIIDNELLVNTLLGTRLPFNCFELIKEPNYPKSWKELNLERFSNNVYTIDYSVSILDNKDLFATEKQAQSALAFAQLTQLHKAMIDEYNRVNNCDWKPDWSNDVEKRWAAVRLKETLNVFWASGSFKHIVFPTKELAEFSLSHHKELWEQYYEL